MGDGIIVDADSDGSLIPSTKMVPKYDKTMNKYEWIFL